MHCICIQYQDLPAATNTPYLHNIVLGCAHVQKVHDLQWIESIGMANKDATFVMLVDDSKHNKASFSTISTDLLQSCDAHL
jgi:hypothetical protein